MLKELIKTHFDIEIIDCQQVKKIDTLVFKVLNTEGSAFVAKLYKEHNQSIVEKIAQNATFLAFVKTHTTLNVQLPPKLYFPLVKWKKEKRYLVLGNWIEGETPKIKDAPFMQQMGAMMAQLHNAATAFTPKIDVLTIDNVLVQRVQGLILANQHHFEFDKKTLANAFKYIDSVYKRVGEDPSVFGLIHTDLHFDNVIITPQNAVSPIDFDEVAYGHYLLDIGITFNEIEDLEDNSLKEYYCIGYKKYRPLPDSFDTYILDFQRIAGCIYLNWFLDEGNKDLPLNKKLLVYARHSLKKIVS